MVYSLSRLTPEQLAEIQAFEQKTGHKVLAFTDYPVEYELLEPNELETLQKLEQQLGLLLLAVR